MGNVGSVETPQEVLAAIGPVLDWSDAGEMKPVPFRHWIVTCKSSRILRDAFAGFCRRYRLTDKKYSPKQWERLFEAFKAKPIKG
jgi:hypothetical protein